MNGHWLAIAMLVLAVLVAGVRSWHLARDAKAKRGWWLMQLLQWAAASLLYLTLFPPAQRMAPAVLVVATAGTTAAQLGGQQALHRVVALPEAPALANIERVPDLATALRQYPESSRVHIVGLGLPLRDHVALPGRALTFTPAPLPRGVAELWSPREVRSGTGWQVSGRAQGVTGGVAELLDPAGQRVDRMTLPEDGRFRLQAFARAPGRVGFQLRVLDRQRQPIEVIDVPLVIANSRPLRLLVLAGGPSPELKYLRRWALDAGLSLHSQLSVGAGLQIGDRPVSLDAASLRAVDLIILDERAWRGLGESRKASLREALRGGLGVLLRITGPLTASERRELLALGFTVGDANIVQTVVLPAIHTSRSVPSASEGSSAASSVEALPLLSRQPLRVTTADGLPLLRDDTGAALALWRSQGQGRIGLWWLGDSYRLVLAGRGDRHGDLWSSALGTLARARGAREPWLLDHDPRPQQRTALCGLAAAAKLVAPSGADATLRIDPLAGASSCAAYWPSEAGWHELQTGDLSWPFFVRAGNQASGLVAHGLQEGTAQRVASSGGGVVSAPRVGPGARWPWFIGWLLASALLWWRERRWRRASVASA